MHSKWYSNFKKIRKDKKEAFLTKSTIKKTDNRNRPTDSSDIELRK